MWKQRFIDLAVTMLQRVGLIAFELATDLARDRAGEQPAAHANPAVHAPAVDRHAGFRQRLLPGKHVRVDGVDEGSVEIKDQCAHGDHRNAECDAALRPNATSRASP